MKQLGAFVIGAFLALSVWAHGGEDHGDGAKPTTAAEAVPRASAATDVFELVAVLEEKRLVIYLDRYETNEPVAKAKVEVDGEALKGVAEEIAEGVYALPLAVPPPAGRHLLAFTVEAGDAMDILSAALDLFSSTAAIGHVHSWSEWATWGASGAVLLAGIGMVVVRRRKRAQAKGI